MANLQNPSVDKPSTSDDYTGCYYDIFINHRGPDLKNTFASHLYHCFLSYGLQSFLDREESQKGELLTPQIEGAIKTASIHIAIFSPGYADSTWCLDELLLIMNKFKSGDTIIPVFYKVKPSDLRWTRGRYAEALSNHEQKGRYNPQTLENVRKALSQVSYIVGFELEAYNCDEGKLLDDVVKCVLKKGRKIDLNVARYPTGLEEKVEEFEKTMLLQQRQSGKVKIMGIVGMGGLGKTTLAKHLFNMKSSNFGKSCFLFDVRENAARRSLNSLQTKLIKDLAHRDVQIDHVDQGIEMLRTYLKTSQHALVVLDDVDHADQLHAFSPIKDVLPWDSLILVTSRYKDVLTSSGIAESSIYKLTGLNEQYSQQLFSLHAFCQPHPPSGFKDLVDEFCRACDGLPLSLKVFGGLLCEKSDKSYWKGLLDDLRQTKLGNEILQTLKLSYDALGIEEKQIFLDIACYFIGENMDMAIRIWNGSGWNGLVGFQNLQAKCLVEVDGKNTIKMHDHLRDLGRGIADQEKSCGVSPHRLWPLIEDISDLWQRSSVITEVRGIRTVPAFNDDYGIPESEEESSIWLKSWFGEVFGNCLRRLVNPKPYRSSKLQLVATEDADLESILRRVQAPNLIWLRWNNCPYTCLPSWIPMKNLRVLEACGKKLETLWRPEFQAPLELRELIIYSPLLKFPKSIGQLKHIEKIVVKKSNLKSLPEEICYVRSLKYLDFSDSNLLQMLPNSFGYLTNLQHLDLSSSPSLQMLPDSFGNLIRLKHLDLRNCQNLIITEETFANIRSLEYLNLSACYNVEVLPSQIAHQLSLEHLYMYSLRLKELPADIGNLSSLEVLQLGSPLLEMLPRSLGHISSLKELSFSSCSGLKSLPDSLGLLTRLSLLLLQNVSGMESLPPEVVKLNNLVWLHVSDCPLRELPFKKVAEGERADIELSRLEFLRLWDTKISNISFIEGVCPRLKLLLISSCNDLVEVGALPPTLTSLSLPQCRQLRKMEGLCNLTNLQELDIQDCMEVEELPGLERLISLKKLHAHGCSKLKRLRGLGQLTDLQILSVSSLDALEETASVEDLRSLEELEVKKMEGLCSLPKLQELNIMKCMEVEELPELERLNISLKRLRVYGCSKLKRIRDLGKLRELQTLTVYFCNELVEVGALPPTLISLELFNCPKLKKIGLCNVTNLQELDIHECIELEELPGLERLISLKKFKADGCSKLRRIWGLGQLPELRRLSVSSCVVLEEIASVEDLRSLEKLNIADCPKLQWGRGVLEQLRQRLKRGLEEKNSSRVYVTPISFDE